MSLVDNTQTTNSIRNYALGILVVVYTFNFIDRQILSILLESIKTDLDLSDTSLGFLTGFAFALFYATLGIPIAKYADKGNRRNLIALSLGIWSFMTALSGLAQNFFHLLFARIGVGVGEAGCSPPAHSMIADYFPANKRSTALGIYSLGIPFGIMFGLFAGGWINEVFGWRLAFFVVGIPGILLAFIFRFTVKEPIRGQAEGKVASEKQPSIYETVSYLIKKRSFRHLVFAAALAAFVGYGAITWLPSFFQRSYGMQTSDVGWYLGLILGIPGGLGIFLGGYLSDYFGAKDVRWSLWIAAIAMALTVPFNVYVYLSPTATMSLLWLIIPVALGNFYQAATFSQTQGIVELRMRSVAAAILLFIINIIGLGFGPQSVGIVSDLLNSEYGKDSLRYSLLIFAFLKLWCAFHYYMAGKYLKEDLIKD
jgi:predicted MFS family arabinose efflux permease|tara:strand:+ start:6795 stop:8069 length:1275 start_codon:yes stop_codon:yes gene_type:complete